MNSNVKSKVKAGKKLLVVSAISTVLLVGGISAYFTATDSATNTWTVGTGVDIELQENLYDAATAERSAITPNQELTKDPKIKNTGGNSAYVFAKVTVPKANVKVASDDGSQVSQDLQELFTYQVNSGWTLVTSSETTTAATYIYAYGSATACTALAPNSTTPVLFSGNKIKFKNIVEDANLQGTTLNLPVEGFAIQSADLTSEDVTAPAAVWNVLSGQIAAAN